MSTVVPDDTASQGGVSDPDAVIAGYLDHLTDADHALLAAAEPDAPRTTGEYRALLRRPGAIEHLLSRPALFHTIFGPAGSGAPSGPARTGAASGSAGTGAISGRAGTGGRAGAGAPLLGASPFLVFAVAVQRTATDLTSATHVSEWLGAGRRAPVFDVAPLRQFLASPAHRLFLAELLASYTHVASGSVLVSTRRGWRRQRFSELDPVRLAALLEVVPEAERPGILRRLGDLALFLTGVFPDHLARRGFGPIEEGRLLRAGGIAGTPPPAGPSWTIGDTGAVHLLESLGRRWYRGAFDLMVPPVPASMRVIRELSDSFGHARRALNLVTDRFLFHYRDQWLTP